jgi:hypothetical protein
LAAAFVLGAAWVGTTVSAWLAETAARRLKLDAGRNAIADWEDEHGELTPDELAAGLAEARSLLGRPAPARTTTSRRRRTA